LTPVDLLPAALEESMREGASVYGDDATGGVINIITRKGGRDSQGSIDLATFHIRNLVKIDPGRLASRCTGRINAGTGRIIHTAAVNQDNHTGVAINRNPIIIKNSGTRLRNSLITVRAAT